MRLHRVELQAFGPFATVQRVDFDRLARAGLFLLEGPTGAGKTTVLDAITFALYGGLAGADAAEDRLVSHFADPALRPSVTCEFSVRGLRYLIARIPEHRRPKRRGDGYTTEPMRVHLQRWDGGRWVSMSSNKAEVGDLITDLVGLSRIQFTQVILLPQGEFARFLRCDDDARRAVLTKLFGAGLYDEITAELDRRRGQAVQARQAAESRIGVAVSAAAEAAGLDVDSRSELIDLPASERWTRLTELNDELIAALADADEEAERAAARAQAMLVAQQETATQAGLMARLTQALTALRAHEVTRPDHDQRAARLAAARRAEPVRPLLALLAEAAAAAELMRVQIRRLIGDAVTPELACLLDESADAALVAATGEQAAARAEATAREANTLDHLVSAESSVPSDQAALADLENVEAKAAAVTASLRAARQDGPRRITAAEASLAAARAAASGLQACQEHALVLTGRTTAAGKLAELEPLLAAKATQMRAAVDAHQRLVDLHQRAMDERMAGMAAELAAGLRDEEACPVCGSVCHPAPAPPAAAAVTAEQVAAARTRRDTAASARLRAEQEHADLDRQIAQHRAFAAGQTLASLTAESADLAKRQSAAERAVGQVPELEAELSSLRAEQERLSDRLRAAEVAEAAARLESRRAGAGLAELKQALAKAAAGYPSVAARQSALRQAAQDFGALATALDKLAAALEAEAGARGRAETEALTRGFDSVAAAGRAVLAPARQSSLGEEVESWLQTLTGLVATAQASDLAGLDPAQAEQVQAAARRAATELALARQMERRAMATRDELATRRRRLARRLQEVRQSEASAQALAGATEPVIYLAGLAKGMEGHRRVALTTYVLRYWFEQVVTAANLRLTVMSSGRYELRRSDEGETRRQRAGLTLSVIDRYTGEERSPRSLSGGETFYTSLALALGLADVVKAEAGGVDTETLFIDEGFGSLDPETLDQVLGVIDELRDRGRAVGIVSHIPELKDRIAERIEVRRLPDGSSTLRVVA
jgi:DNA repair protein SbcC/Rad50